MTIPETETASTTDKLTAALGHAARGWRVLPVHAIRDGHCTCGKPSCASAGKHPRISQWQLHATTDEDTIRGWWTTWPDANIGIATGAASDLVVVDFDVNATGGLDVNAATGEVSGVSGVLTSGAWAATGSGGWHFYFRFPQGLEVRNSVNFLGHKVDVRGEGGFVVAPPSVSGKGGYEWLLPPQDEMPPLPQELLDAFAAAAEPKRPHRPTATPPPSLTDDQREDAAGRLVNWALGQVEDGAGRNDTGFKLACQLRDAGLDADEAEGPMLEYQEAAEAYGSHAYDAEEALNSLRQAYSKPPRDPAPLTQPDTQVATAPDACHAEVPDTVLAAAQAFAAAHKDQLAYVVGWGWMYYDGLGWRRASGVTGDNPVFTVYAAWVNGLGAGLAGYAVDARHEFDQRVRAIRMLGNQAAKIIDLAQHFLQRQPAEFDTQPHLLATPSGVVDLRDGAVRDATPHDRLSRRTAVGYDPDARSDLWETTLRQIFHGDETLIGYMQKAWGYALTGETRTHVFHILWGSGRNGKGTCVDAIAAAMGDYSWKVASSSFLAKRWGETATNDLADLDGVRLAYAEEPDTQARLNMPRIKELTGGGRINARRLYHEAYVFTPTAKFFLCVNPLPTVKDSSDGAWERLRLVPFTVSFAGHEDVTLPAKLRAEAKAILAWLVRGARRYYAEGLDACPAVEAAGREYVALDDPARAFFTQHVTKSGSPTDKIEMKTLHDHYLASLDPDERTDGLSKKAFAQLAASLGYRARRSHGKNWVLGAVYHPDDFSAMGTLGAPNAAESRKSPAREDREEFLDYDPFDEPDDPDAMTWN